MSSTTFTNNVTLTDAAWFNDVNTVAYTIFGDGSSYTGNITLNTNKFTVAYASGNTVIAGTASIAGTLTAAAINASGLVAMAGNATVGGTLGVTGSFTASAGSSLIGNVSVGGAGVSNGAMVFYPSAGSFWWVDNNSGTFRISSGVSAGATSTLLTGTSTGVTIPGTLGVTGAITGLNATAIPAGGTTGSGLLVSSTANFGVFFGSGAPTLSAAKGSLYLRSDGSTTNDRMYVNTNGTTTWTAVTTAA